MRRLWHFIAGLWLGADGVIEHKERARELARDDFEPYDGGGIEHQDWCEWHWECCGRCKCGAQRAADRQARVDAGMSSTTYPEEARTDTRQEG